MAEIIPIYPLDKEAPSDKPIVEFDYEKSDDKIILNITCLFPGFTILDAERKAGEEWKGFKEVKMSGTGFLSVDSKPLLPSFRRLVQIPPGYGVDVDEITFEKNNRMEDMENVLIKWAEETVKDEGKFDFDEEKYNADEFWPKVDEVIEVSGPFYLDGYKTLLIDIRPLQYNPSKKRLCGYGKISVTIPLSPLKMSKQEEDEELALTDQTTNLEAFGNYLLNPRRKAYEEDLATETSTEGTPAENEEAEFLIIYDKKFEEPVERLKKWKTQRGLKTETISTEEIEDSNDEEKREWIRERIQERRRKPHSTLRYVLLFGEVDSIPMSQGKVSTDHYFYTHKKTSGSECLLPWVSGGRIPMKNVDDATYIVDQIICYESEPPDDPGYYKRMTLAGHFQDREDFRSHRACRDGRAERNYIETMENIWKHMKSRGIEPKRAYFSNTLKTKDYLYSDGAKMPDDVKEDIIAPEGDEEEGLEMAECRVTKLIIKLINEGQLIVGHRGHGNDDGWTSPPFMVKDLAFISCDWPCIFFSINCSTGAYNAFKKSFAEHALARNGATSLVAATYPTNAWRNDSLIKALFDAVWPEMLPNFPDSVRSYEVKNRRLGDVLNYAKAYLLVKHGANSETKVLFESYHVIGDPTLEIWKDEPSKVSLQAGIASGNLTITMSTCPRDAVLTIWSGDKFLASKKPVSTQASLALGDLQEDPPYSVCFSAPGYRFAEIPVESD